jgi:PAS domain S-box-containing protein
MNFSINLKRSNLLSSMPSAWLVLTLSLTLTGWLWYNLKESRSQTNYAQFERRVERVKTAIINRMATYEQALQGGVALFNTLPSVSRTQWHEYVKHLQINRHYPGIQGMGFSQRIEPSQTVAHRAQMRAAGFPNYTLRPEGEREEYTAIIYLEPLEQRNLKAIGYDMFSEPTRHAAMVQARDTGLTTLSGKVTLVQEIDKNKQAGFLMYLPVYRQDLPNENIAQRRAALLGYVYAPFRANDLMAKVIDEPLDIDFKIYDGDTVTPTALIYDETPSPADYSPPIIKLVPVVIGGRTWTLHFASLPQFEAAADNGTPEIVLVTGILMSFLLFLMIRGNARLSDSQGQLQETIKQLHHLKNTLEQEVAHRIEALQQEIQERMQVERALREVHERFLTVLDGLEAIVYVADMQTHEFLFTNKYVRNLVSTQEGLAGQICWQTMHTGQTGPCAFCTNDKLVSPEGEPTGVYTWELQNTISKQWFYIQDRAIRWTDGRLVRLEIATDITQRKQTEVELSKSVSLLHATLEATADGILVVDKEGRIAGFNQNFVQMWRIPEAVIASKDDNQTLQTVLGQLQEPQKFIDKVKELYAHPHQESFDLLKFRDGRVFERYSKPQRLGNETIGRVWSFRDITERKRAEAEQHKLIALVENSYDMIAISSLEGQISYMNSAGLKMVGLDSPAGWKGTQIADYHPPEDFARLSQELLPAVIAYGYWEGENNFRHFQTGTLIAIHQHIFAAKDPQGQLVGFYTIARDITEHKRAEEALRQSEERFDLAMRGSNDGIWDWDVSTNQVYFSRRLRQIFGLTEEETASVEAFNKVIHPDDVAIIWERMNAYLEKKLPSYEITFRLSPQNGQNSWVLSRAIAVWNEQGKPIRLVGTIMDITTQKQAEEELRQAKESAEQAYLETSSFKAVLDKTVDYVAMHDPDTLKFVYANQGALDQTGYSREELLQMTTLDLNPMVKAESIAELFAPLQSGIAIRFETVHQHKNGTLIPVDVQLQFVEIGQIKRLVAMARDITERKRFELSLQQAKEAAEFANRAKSIFLANMSHELRTPLNGILGYTQILQRDKTLTPKQLDGVNIIHRSGEYLLTLINDVLDLSKIEAGKVELLPVDFDFNEFLLGLIDLFQMRAQQKGIAFNYEPLSHLPVGIRADEKRLRQILINLLGNAVKFTQHGGVTLKMGYHNGHIRFQVEDTGVGIAATDLEKIFEPFQQVGDQQYKAEGTGLGLPITKKLVEMMGGELHVESMLGKGSTFWMAIALPEVSNLVKAKREQAPVIIGCQGPSRTILIIDDKWENRSVLTNLLTPLGFISKEASHGEEGLNLLKVEPVDLIITDLVMPVMDGFEFARQLRKLPDFQTVPIIAASASVFDAHQQESLTAGCNAFMAKPFHVDVLLELLQKQLGLTWIYEQTTVNSEQSPVPTDNPSPNPAEMIGPTKEQTAVLFDLAMQGDIAGIVEEVNRLEQADGRLATFAKQIRQLAKNFEEQQICELVEKYMSESSALGT